MISYCIAAYRPVYSRMLIADLIRKTTAPYHRSILPLLLSIPLTEYCCLGAAVRGRLSRQRQQGLLCTGMKVFHAVGPAYASLFGMLDFEIAKYQRLGRADIVRCYETEPRPPREELATRFAAIAATLDAALPVATA